MGFSSTRYAISLVTDDEADDELRKQLSMALYGPQQPQVKTSRANIVDWNVEATGYWTKKENRDEFNSLNQSFQDISFLEEPSPSLPTTDRHFKQIPIPPDGRERVKRVWRRRSFNDSDVVASGLQCSVTQRDLCRLDGLEWLNDSLVNMYMAMINDRANRSGASVPRVHCFNSHFLPKLRHDGYEKMQRWTKRVDLFSMEYVIVPVHRGSHWTTAIINFVEKRFEYYDSLAGGGQDVQDLLRMYLDDECMAKKGRTFPLEDWADFTPVHLTPQQDNGSDCGVFACQFSEYRSRGSSGIPLGQIFDFGQEQMPYFRLRMAHEILEKRLMIS
ncbi:hypothetical protein SARC_06598 [Sphaeroforma arctica JP610]|uniref:Ubiquitin-like protease family profile domain-containing protein n=1 Tax=Sphaeroforma arctica JP610 TaxID=667725 RepID=A0A0L0FWX2_9EUKA|nr:hypothetical protein SARC_06598 [Sphaeroforma arctica JP610]KNC81056.1 hypothetical protein SARC_06598 [Sphaeroforma arctica JP610]|eukprot:XP_014154958.1 hypothetical protein SARC_06598 [Sphaeroforma arctica JP610]